MVSATNDVVQLLADRTAIASVRFHYSTTTSGATFAGTSNWVDMGALDPASPGFEFNKEIAQVMTGSPMTVKQQHITQWSGTMSGEVIDYNDTTFQASVGTNLDFSVESPMGWVDTTVAAGASTRSHLFLTDVSDLAVGDWIVLELGNASFTFFESRKILAITPGTSPAGEVDLQGTLSQIPAVGADVIKVDYIATIIGGNSLRDYQMRSIASFNDGTTMVIHAPKGNFTGAISPNFGDGSSPVRIPVEFGILGTSSTVPGFTCPQVTLATHYAYAGNC
jgi:hypothetical protein